MTENILVEGIELVRVNKLVDEYGQQDKCELRHMTRIIRYLKGTGIKDLRYDESDMLTSNDGPIYALPGGGFTSHKKVYGESS